jgi:sulfate permease, SulP family
MAYGIIQEVGEDNPKSVIATTILAFSISSIITGLVFFLLGALNLGALIGFFPRHILVGCIGGVGWFLFITGIEVSARLEGNLSYNFATLKALFQLETLPLWTVPLALAGLLMQIQRKWKHPLIVPMFFMFVPMIFYLVISCIPSVGIADLRRLGWIFEAPKSDQPWWHFYTLYGISYSSHSDKSDFRATNWTALTQAFPAMLALTFFGILHVPINVPALGVSTGEDHLDVDRELIAHGVSNALSGFAGSIQNYLVYTNSLLFIRSGGNSRSAGVMLAIATTGILFAGTGIVGYIPVMVVGALIFLLGMDLLIEALYDTWSRVNKLEYLTIIAIIFSMAAWDFVFGILVGIVLSAFFFVIQASRKTAIRAIFSGLIAKSTVRRHPFQQRFLKQVARQIYVLKLSGYMFFGTIGSVEKTVREFLSDRRFEENPIRYLVLDFTLVSGVDYSAAETFIRMRRLLDAKVIHLILSGVKDGSDVAKSLKNVGMWSDGTDWGVKNFEDLNAALEWCENALLSVYYEKKAFMARKPGERLGKIR